MSLAKSPVRKRSRSIRCLDDRLEGRERGEAIAAEFLRRCPPGQVKTIAIPGNGSSPLGAAAFGKAVAVATENPVASIVVGQGAFDKWNKSFAGAFLMAGPANIYNVADPFLEAAARSNPIIREGLRAYVAQIVDALDKSATALRASSRFDRRRTLQVARSGVQRPGHDRRPQQG